MNVATTSFRLPFLFIVTGIISFLLFHVLSLMNTAGWIGEYPRSPLGWAFIHLLVLGWATMIAMGAVYQLIHVVLQRNIESVVLGYVHYGCYLLGTIGLLIGFYTSNPAIVGVAASFAAAGIIFFICNVGITLCKAKIWNSITFSTATALFWLGCTAVSGLLMGLNLHYGWFPHYQDQLLSAHIWFGTFGWFGSLITGFSYKMLPMFYLSHGNTEHKPLSILGIWNSGVLVSVMSHLWEWPTYIQWLGFFLITVAFILYSMYMDEIIRIRHKKNPGLGIQFTVWLTKGITLFFILVLIWWILFPNQMTSLNRILLVGWTYVWGWVAMTILGYMSKIVPFLWWTDRYGSLVGKQNVPLMSDMINEKHVQYGLYFISGSFLWLAVGLSWNHSAIIQVSGSALSLCSIAYMILIIKVFTR